MPNAMPRDLNKITLADVFIASGGDALSDVAPTVFKLVYFSRGHKL